MATTISSIDGTALSRLDNVQQDRFPAYSAAAPSQESASIPSSPG